MRFDQSNIAPICSNCRVMWAMRSYVKLAGWTVVSPARAARTAAFSAGRPKAS